MEWQKVMESLVASGPLAAALGLACGLLWRALTAERAAREADNRARVDDLKALLKLKD